MTSAARVFADFYRYNRWANGKVFAVCGGVDPATLTAQAQGTTGTIEDTLKHLVGVEEVYLLMLQDIPLGPPESRDSYFAHDVAWFAERAGQLGDGYQELLPKLDDTALGSTLRVPWFDVALTKRDGLFQVLAHSSQHRAQVLSVLGAQGIAVPDVDYILMLEEERGQKHG